MPPYIKSADNNILVVCENQTLAKVLLELGFENTNIQHEFIKNVLKDEKALLLGKLRDMGFYFSYGKEWNPTEIFELYREQGIVQGKYNRITWEGNNKFYLTENL